MQTQTLRVERQFVELQTEQQGLGDRVNTLEESYEGLKYGSDWLRQENDCLLWSKSWLLWDIVCQQLRNE